MEKLIKIGANYVTIDVPDDLEEINWVSVLVTAIIVLSVAVIGSVIYILMKGGA